MKENRICPYCGHEFKKNGLSHTKKQSWYCNNCKFEPTNVTGRIAEKIMRFITSYIHTNTDINAYKIFNVPKATTYYRKRSTGDSKFPWINLAICPDMFSHYQFMRYPTYNRRIKETDFERTKTRYFPVDLLKIKPNDYYTEPVITATDSIEQGKRKGKLVIEIESDLFLENVHLKYKYDLLNSAISLDNSDS